MRGVPHVGTIASTSAKGCLFTGPPVLPSLKITTTPLFPPAEVKKCCLQYKRALPSPRIRDHLKLSNDMIMLCNGPTRSTACSSHTALMRKQRPLCGGDLVYESTLEPLVRRLAPPLHPAHQRRHGLQQLRRYVSSPAILVQAGSFVKGQRKQPCVRVNCHQAKPVFFLHTRVFSPQGREKRQVKTVSSARRHSVLCQSNSHSAST